MSIQDFNYLFGGKKYFTQKTIEWFIEDQAFLSSYDWAPPLSDTQEDWEETNLLTGEGGGGGGGAQIYDAR